MGSARGLAVTSVLWVALVACAESPHATVKSDYTAAQDPLTVHTPIERYTLPSGLVVVLNRDQRVPAVAVRVVYRAGSADDPGERGGMAHLVEHLMFHGSRHVSGLGHADYLRAAGAVDINAATESDRTDFYETVPSSELLPTLWLEGDRMATGLEPLSQSDVERECRIVAHEHEERVESVMEGAVGDILSAALFPAGHPYRSRAGAGLEGTTLDEARAFHRDYYGPNDALLVLAGDFDLARTKRAVEAYFGSIPRRARPPALSPPPWQPSGPRTLQIEARVPRATVLFAWPTPALFATGDAELDAFAFELSHSARTLVERGLVNWVEAEQHSRSLGSVFGVVAHVHAGAEPRVVSDALLALMVDLEHRSLAPSDVEKASSSFLYRDYLRQDSLLYRTLAISDAELFGGSASFLEVASRRYRAVTAASVGRTVRAYLRPEYALTAFVTPNPAAPRSGRLVGSP